MFGNDPVRDTRAVTYYDTKMRKKVWGMGIFLIVRRFDAVREVMKRLLPEAPPIRNHCPTVPARVRRGEESPTRGNVLE